MTRKLDSDMLTLSEDFTLKVVSPFLGAGVGMLAYNSVISLVKNFQGPIDGLDFNMDCYFNLGSATLGSFAVYQAVRNYFIKKHNPRPKFSPDKLEEIFD